MKNATLIRISAALSLAVLAWAGPARAQTEKLDQCIDRDYPYYARYLLLDISPPDAVPPKFDLEIDLDGKARTVPVAPTGEWRKGRAPGGFKLDSIDLQPRIPGFTVSGPESCQFQVIRGDQDLKECAALYRFRVHQMKLTLEADPPEEAALRLTSDAGPKLAPDAGCALPRSTADAQLETKVQEELGKDAAFASFAVEVTARGGDVYLSGLVNSRDAAKKVGELARAAGARKVVNKIQVESCASTALLDLDQKTVTIERVQAGELLFAATIRLPEDRVRTPWKLTRTELENARAQEFQRFSPGTGAQRGRTAKLVPSDLGNLQKITITRSTW